MRSVALIVATSILASCTMSKSAKSSVTMLGAVTSVAGIALVAAGPDEVDSNHNGRNEWALNDDYSKPLLGTLLVLVGLATLAGGLGARTLEDEPRAIVTPVASAEPASTETWSAPSLATPPMTSTTSTTSTSSTPTPMTRPALPEVAVDDETLRLAKTMRHVALAGNCQAAGMLLDKIAARSHAYYQALVTGPVLDPCPQLRPRTEFGTIE